jgi:hypothetical protein
MRANYSDSNEQVISVKITNVTFGRKPGFGPEGRNEGVSGVVLERHEEESAKNASADSGEYVCGAVVSRL